MRLITDNHDLEKTLDRLFINYEKYFIAVAWLKDLAFKSLISKQYRISSLLTSVTEVTGNKTHFCGAKNLLETISKLEDNENVSLRSCKSWNNVFHPKVMLFTSFDETRWECIVGSYNLNKKGLVYQIQTSIWLSHVDDPDGELLKQLHRLFDDELIETTRQVPFKKYIRSTNVKLEKNKTYHEAKRIKKQEEQADFLLDEDLAMLIVQEETSLLDNPDSSGNLDALVEQFLSKLQTIQSSLGIDSPKGNISKEDFEALISQYQSKDINWKNAIVLIAATRPDLFPLYEIGKGIIPTRRDFRIEDYWKLVNEVQEFSDHFFSKTGLNYKALLYGLFPRKQKKSYAHIKYVTFSEMLILGTKPTFNKALTGLEPIINKRDKTGRLYYFLESYLIKELTLEEIGSTLGLSRERCRQLKEKALRRLKSLASRKVDEGLCEPDLSGIISTLERVVPTETQKPSDKDRLLSEYLIIIKAFRAIILTPEKPVNRPTDVRDPYHDIYNGLTKICEQNRDIVRNIGDDKKKLIAEKMPVTKTELHKIHYIGRKTLATIGDQIIDLVKSVKKTYNL